MRFGIMAMQMNALIPTGKPEEALSQISRFSEAALVKKLNQAGFNPIEIGGDLILFMPHCFLPQPVNELVELKKEGISYTVHLPLWSVEPSTLLDPVREGSIKALVNMIKATLPIQPESYVLHATGALAAEFSQMRLPETAKGLLLRQFQARAKDSIKHILAETGIPSRKLAIETIEFPFNLTLEIAEELDLSFCLDTGHVLAGFSGPVELFEVLEKIMPRLAQIHLHDSPWQGLERKIQYDQDHQALGKGDLDIAKFLDYLAKANFNGPIIFELTLEEALASIEVIRQCRPQYLPK